MATRTLEDTGIRVTVCPAQSAFFAGETFSVTVTFTNTRSSSKPSQHAKRSGTQAHKRAAHSISLAPLAKPPTSPITPKTSLPTPSTARPHERAKGKHERKGLVGLGGNGNSVKSRLSRLEATKGKSMSVALSPQDLVDVLPASSATPQRRDSTVPFNHPHARKQSYDNHMQAELQLKELSSSPPLGATDSASASTSTFSLSLDTINEDTHSYPPKKGAAHLGLGLGPPPASPDAHAPPRTALASTFAQPGTELVLYAYAQLGGALTLGAHMEDASSRPGSQAQALAAVRGLLHRKQAVGGGRMDISSSLDSPAPPTPMSRNPSRHSRTTSLSSSIMSLLAPPTPTPTSTQFQLQPPPRRPTHKARTPSLFGSLLSTSVSSPPAIGLGPSLSPPEDIPSDTPLPTFDVPPAMLAVDLVLAPGESRSYSYNLPLPANLPPTFRGRSLKFTYHLVVGVCRSAPPGPGTAPGPGNHGSTSQVMRVPVRIYNHVDLMGVPRPYDLLWPALHKPAKDTGARVIELGRTTAAGVSAVGKAENSLTPVNSNAPQGRQHQADTLVDLKAYALQLLASLPAPSDEAKRLQASVGVETSVPRTPKVVLDDEDEPEPSSCREAVEILTRTMRKSSFDVNKDGVKVAVLTFTKSAYRLGETIVGAVEINDRCGRSRVLKLSVMLESQESLPSTLSGSSAAAAPPPKTLRKLHAESYAALTPSTLRVPFALDIPSDGSPAFQCVCAPPDTALVSSIGSTPAPTPTRTPSSSSSSNTPKPGGLSWTVRLCLLVCVASPYARAGVGGARLKHLVRDGVQGEWGSSWKPTRGIAPLQNVDLRKERRALSSAAAAASSKSKLNLGSKVGVAGGTGAGAGMGTGAGANMGGTGQEQQRGWASYLLSSLLTPHEREYHDGDEADSDSGSGSETSVVDVDVDVGVGVGVGGRSRGGERGTDPSLGQSHSQGQGHGDGDEEAHPSSTPNPNPNSNADLGLDPDSEEHLHTKTIRPFPYDTDLDLDLGAAGRPSRRSKRRLHEGGYGGGGSGSGSGSGSGGGDEGWSELRTETVECTVPVVVLPGNTMFRPLEVVFDV